jgi:16S rRNA (adenine1518-N6/adenine1519-N6)-dimethyltransferase
MGQRFGQHFLRDFNVLRQIVAAADLAPGQRVLEIGPGRGVLTDPLSKAVGPNGHVVAVEADPEMANPLDGRWDNVEVHIHDVMKVDLASLGPFDRIVANLPYQISGPVTAKLLALLRQQGWGKAVLMYQKEFGQRLVAGPGSKAYGKLSVQSQRHCVVAKVRDVPPGCFDPPPKVDSIVLSFTPHAEQPFVVSDEARFQTVLDQSFSQRRKQLRNSLKGLVSVASLESLGVADERPEQIEPSLFARIAEQP